MADEAYSWRLEVRYGVRRLLLVDAAGRELRWRICLSDDPAVQLAVVQGMILDHEKAAR